MDFDDLDDFSWKDGVIIGGFVDFMVEEEDEDEHRRQKIERKMVNPDDCDDWCQDDDEDYL